MSHIFGTATKAVSAITSSSGMTMTIPAIPGFTIVIDAIKVYNGPSLISINDAVTIQNTDKGSDFRIPLQQILSEPTYISERFTVDGLEPIRAISVNMPVSFVIPALLGGAETTMIVFYRYQ